MSGKAAPDGCGGTDGFGGAVSALTVEHVITRRLSDLLGGWRGAIEMGLPTIAFVGVWFARKDVKEAVIASAVAVAVLVVARLVQRQTMKHALSSVFPTAIAAAVALRTGNAQDAFLPGMVWNAGMSAVALVSVLVRWPLMGFMVAAADPAALEDPAAFTRWRQDKGMVRVCSRLTLVLAVLFVVRIAIMFPLYWAQNIAGLGLAKLVLGWPAYVTAVAIMAAMLVRGSTPTHEPVHAHPHEPVHEDPHQTGGPSV